MIARRLPTRILAAALLSVAAAGGLLIVGLNVAQPLIREGVVRHFVNDDDLAACAADPTSWGGRTDIATRFAYDRTGRSLNPDAPDLTPAQLEEALSSGEIAHVADDPDRATMLVPVADAGPCALVLVESRRVDRVFARRLRLVLLVTTLVGMVIVAAATWWLVVRPLRARVLALSEAAQGVGSEGFAAPEPSDDALGQVAAVLSESHDRIVETRAALEQRNVALEQHLASIAHDLRTPLASMQLALEAMTTRTAGGPQQDARRALSDLVYLTSLVENLHQGARLRQDVDVTGGIVDLVELVDRLEGRFRIIGRNAGVEVAASVPETSVWAACAPPLAERAVANLVQNAVEHNPGHGHVAIVLSTSADGARFELLVADDGPGLPDAVLASLEEESFLLDSARQRGPGLGMLITAEIARRAGWTLTYEALEPIGLRVLLAGDVVGNVDYGGARAT